MRACKSDNARALRRRGGARARARSVGVCAREILETAARDWPIRAHRCGLVATSAARSVDACVCRACTAITARIRRRQCLVVCAPANTRLALGARPSRSAQFSAVYICRARAGRCRRARMARSRIPRCRPPRRPAADLRPPRRFICMHANTRCVQYSACTPCFGHAPRWPRL
eukprot:IDg17256t1